MDNTITIKFRGLCTQMINKNTWVPNAPCPLNLCSEGREVAIRVFLANSELISSEIEDPKYRPPHHYPMILFEKAMVSEEALRQSFQEVDLVDDALWQVTLPRVALEFRGVATSQAVIEESFKKLPSVFALTPETHKKPEPRPEAVDGFAEHAQAYIDLLTGFRIEKIGDTDEVLATLTFDGTPELIVKPNNRVMPGPVIPLKFGKIEIHNFPALTVCSEWDYLLHYFATMTSLKGKPPVWPRPDVGNPSPEVYCSSSGYP